MHLDEDINRNYLHKIDVEEMRLNSLFKIKECRREVLLNSLIGFEIS